MKTEYYHANSITKAESQWGRFLGMELYTITLDTGEVVSNCTETTRPGTYRRLYFDDPDQLKKMMSIELRRG